MSPEGQVQWALRLIADEVVARGVDLEDAGAALDAAVPELIEAARATWPVPVGAWQQLVVALAVVVLRLHGGGLGRAAARVASRAAVRALQGPGVSGGPFCRACRPPHPEPAGSDTHDPQVPTWERK